MSWRKCATRSCSTMIRIGLRRDGVGAGGQPLADGVFCARCRSRDVDPSRKPLKVGDHVVMVGGNFDGLRGRFAGRSFKADRADVDIGPMRFSVPQQHVRRDTK